MLLGCPSITFSVGPRHGASLASPAASRDPYRDPIANKIQQHRFTQAPFLKPEEAEAERVRCCKFMKPEVEVIP